MPDASFPPVNDRLYSPEEVIELIGLPSSHLGLTWKPIGADDVPVISALTQGLNKNQQISAAITAERLEALVAHDHLCIAIHGLDVSGVAQSFGIVEFACAQEPCLADISGVVSNAWRGRGIGRTLLDWQIKSAHILCGGYRCRGSSETKQLLVRCVVNRADKESRRLLAAGGFSPEETRRFGEKRIDTLIPFEEPQEHDVAYWIEF